MVGSGLRVSEKRVKKTDGKSCGKGGAGVPLNQDPPTWVLPLDSCGCLVSLHVVHRE